MLVTGADGFVGSHLTEALATLGSEVFALVHQPDALKNLVPLKDRFTLLSADVRNYSQIHAALKSLRGHEGLIVFHLAAQAHVGESWQKPEITLETNLLGTLNILRALHDLSIPLHSFDYAGTSEEYGRFDPSKGDQYRRDAQGAICLDENAPLNPQSIYASSKVAADFLCRNFYEAYGLPIIVTRMFNNFGPRQRPSFITSSVISQALNHPVISVGSTEAKRDFTYIQDGVRGHLLAALHGSPGEVYVFGQGQNISIRDWILSILTIGQQRGFWPPREIVVQAERLRPGRTDEADLLADSSKLRRLTGWQPEVGWEEGILSTIQWYAENRAY